MNRFLIFCGSETLQPQHYFGWKGLHKDFESFEDAEEYVDKYLANKEWWHIVDTKHNEIVLKKD